MHHTPREEWHLDTQHIGRRVAFFDSLPSTNDLAHEWNEPGTAIVADAQTAGRGQYSRAWQSRPGCSLLMSVTLDPPPALARPVALIAWAAVAVADAILTLTALQATIKWPNDILLSGKKVCGILTETQRSSVVGIGLNLSQTAGDFAAEGLPAAMSLALASGPAIAAAPAVNVLLRKLDSEYERLLRGETVPLETEWKRRLGLLGRHVTFALTDGATVSGRLKEMGFDGIELEAGDGAFQVIAPEHVRAMSAA